MKEMNLNEYEDEYGRKLSDMYAMFFRNTYCGDYPTGSLSDMCADEDEPSQFEIIRRHENELKRFRLDCDMGLLNVEIRVPKEGESWTVPVTEAFLEYLATKHVLRGEEYGIDVSNMIHVVGTRLTDHDRFFARFLPESVVTKNWIRFIAGVYGDIVRHVDVDDDFLEELLELNSEVIRYIPEHKVTLERAVKAVRTESFNLAYIPHGIQLRCAELALGELQSENLQQKKLVEYLRGRLAEAVS
ncbi:hypothetical protein [Pseudomonas yangonensis]|uniref:hypothetical protein n=1 Tax=Pseudomonas yangonensis TaxID=2579922 RepID=UPI001379FBB7|nr:hypothetical protein [Pseudomonas yangonensis]